MTYHMALTSFESVPTKNYGQPRMRSHANAFGFVWRQTFERPLEHVLADTNEGSPGRGSDKPEHEASPTERLYVCLRHRATTIFMLLALSLIHIYPMRPAKFPTPKRRLR